jgi:peptidyl-prolyl cis-trans isomerase-like protein 2
MGKKQHSKDQLYLTRTEHASGEHRGRGKQLALNLPYRTLPFDCCAISFRPFETPLCTSDGIVFELLNVVPFLKKFRRHPVTGKPLSASDLIKLHFHKNPDGQYACPVMYKPFTQHTHIVAIKTTGNVYCYDAVRRVWSA